VTPDASDVTEVVTRKVVNVLDALGIPYLVGGSVASSIHGIPRLTRDVDLVAEIREEHAPALVAAWQDEFYVDEDLIREAVREEGSFNIIYLASMYKADVFVAKQDEWSRQVMARRRLEPLSANEQTPHVYVASPEDMILQKLLWYRMGGGVSDSQWNDIQNVLKVQAGALDYRYLRRWAGELGITDLLDEAFADAEFEP
jgi:hypothetical protein